MKIATCFYRVWTARCDFLGFQGESPDSGHLIPSVIFPHVGFELWHVQTREIHHPKFELIQLRKYRRNDQKFTKSLCPAGFNRSKKWNFGVFKKWSRDSGENELEISRNLDFLITQTIAEKSARWMHRKWEVVFYTIFCLNFHRATSELTGT